MTRACPRCGASLEETHFEGRLRDASSRLPIRVHMDECPKGCGFWFDRQEAEATLGVRGELRGEESGEGAIGCPACAGRLRPFIVLGVELERCRACAGFWFDAGEVKKVAGAFNERGIRMDDTATYSTCSNCGKSNLDANGMYFGETGMVCPACYLDADLDALEAKVLAEERSVGVGTSHGRGIGTLMWLVAQSPTIEDLD